MVNSNSKLEYRLHSELKDRAWPVSLASHPSMTARIRLVPSGQYRRRPATSAGAAPSPSTSTPILNSLATILSRALSSAAASIWDHTGPCVRRQLRCSAHSTRVGCSILGRVSFQNETTLKLIAAQFEAVSRFCHRTLVVSCNVASPGGCKMRFFSTAPK